MENENSAVLSSSGGGSGRRRHRRRGAPLKSPSGSEHLLHQEREHPHYQKTRAFGRVIQDSCSSSSSGVKGGTSSLKHNHHDHETNSNKKKFAPPAAPRLLPPSASSPRGADLNNSFTEKISNLDIGLFGDDDEEDGDITLPPPPTPVVVVAPATATSSTSRRGTSTAAAAAAIPTAGVSGVPVPAAPSRRPPLRERTLDSNNWRNFDANIRSSQPPPPEYLYSNEILNYLSRLELEKRVDPGYMEKQADVSFKMRSILVDWMVEVVSEYSLGNPTLHRAVHFVDRYLSCRHVTRGYLQLLGTAAIFVASKIEDVQPPDTSDLVFITDNTYEKRELILMEMQILSTLDFDLLTPTAHEFTQFFSTALRLSVTTRQAADYIIELTLLHGDRFLKFNASQIALASSYVAVRCCGEKLSQLNNRHHRSNNKSKQKSTTTTTTATTTAVDASSVTAVLSQIPRLNLHPEFVAVIEEIVALIFLTLLSGGQVFESKGSSSSKQYITESKSSVSSSSSSSDGVANGNSSNSGTSIANKYKQFQTERFLAAAASSAACMPTMPWDR